MSWVDGLRARWHLLVHRRAAEARIEQELGFHVDLETERLVRETGLAPDEARRRALANFGGVEAHREELRAGRGLAWLGSFALDLRLGARILRKTPGLTVVGVVGMGMAVAIASLLFTMVTLATHPVLPLPGGERVVGLRIWDREANASSPTTPADFLTWKTQLTTMDDVGAFRMGEINMVLPDGSVEPTTLASMTASGFRAAGVAPLLGRYFTDADERTGAAPVIVIGYQVWQSHLAGARSAIGSVIRLADRAFTVVGVMPKGFAFPVYQSAWIPLQLDAAGGAAGAATPVLAFGRLAEGVRGETAQGQLAAIGRRMAADDPATWEHQEPRVVLFPALVNMVADGSESTDLRSLPFLIVLLLAVVCVNVATLVYARTATRQGEIAVRASLGASRGRILSQLFTEALLLSALASLGGLGVARLGYALMVRVLRDSGSGIPFWMDARLTGSVVWYVVLLTIVAALIIGLLPAVGVARRGVQSTLGLLSGGTSVRLGKAWTMLIVAQVAVAMTVLPGVVFQGARYAWYAFASPGFPAAEYLTAHVEFDASTASAAATSAARGARLAALERRLERTPGVLAVTFSSGTPGEELQTHVEIEGSRDTTDAGHGPKVRLSAIAPDFLDQFGVRLVAGRTFTSGDYEGGAPVLVNEAFVHDVLGGRSAVGRRLRRKVPITRRSNAAGTPGDSVKDPWAVEMSMIPWSPPDLATPIATTAVRLASKAPDMVKQLEGRLVAKRAFIAGDVRAGARTIRHDGRSQAATDENSWETIVGVVTDFPPNRIDPEAAQARVYRPLSFKASPPTVEMSMRTTSPAALAARLRTIAVEVDPGIRLTRILPLDEVYRVGERGLARLAAVLLVIVTLSVLALTAAGMYALMSFAVTRRRREIGIRAALGADPRRLLGSVFSQAAGQLAFGSVIGIVGAASLNRYTGGALLEGHHAIVLPVVLLLMTLNGLVASLGPARRGLRIPPAEALRSE